MLTARQKKVLWLLKDFLFYAMILYVAMMVRNTCQPELICGKCLTDQYFNVSNISMNLSDIKVLVR